MSIPTPPDSGPPSDPVTPPGLPTAGGGASRRSPRSPSQPPATESRHTRAITVVSVLAVSVAALFAVGANLGILHNADETKVGSLSAASDLLPEGSNVVDVYLDQAGATPDASGVNPSTSKTFQVDQAGTVTVSVVGGRARVDSIDPVPGWTGKAVQASGMDVAVSFGDGARTLEFVATANSDGTIAADVTTETGSPTRAVSQEDHEDSHHDGDHDDHDEDHGDGDHSKKDHDGGDDDD